MAEFRITMHYLYNDNNCTWLVSNSWKYWKAELNKELELKKYNVIKTYVSSTHKSLMSYSESFTECHSQVVSILASYFECPMLKSWFIVIEVLWFSGKCRNSILNYVIIINHCHFIVLINKLSENTNLGLQFFYVEGGLELQSTDEV